MFRAGVFLVLLTFARLASADEPDWGDSTPAQVAFWVLVFLATPFAVASLAIFILGLLDLLGTIAAPACCAASTYFWLNITCLCLWPFGLALSIYLVVAELQVAAVYLGWAILAILLHTLLLILYIKKGRRSAQDHPRQQLLTAQKYSDKNPVPDATSARDVNTGGDDAAAANQATQGAAAAALAAISAHPSNPFPATYGLLPGTSQYGYQIFIPTEHQLPDPQYGTPTGKEVGRHPHRHSRARSHDTDQTRSRTMRQ